MPTAQTSPHRFIDEDDDLFDRAHPFHPAEKHDHVDEKIAREVYIMGGGTIDAARSAFSKEHIGETVAETGVSLAAGLALRAAEAKVPLLRPAIAAVGLAMTYSFARDLVGHGGQIAATMSDVWQNPEHREQGRRAFAEQGGKFAVDFALTAAGGAAGAGMGERFLHGAGSNFVRIPTYDGLGLRGSRMTPHDRLYSKDDSIAQLFEGSKASTLVFNSSAKGSPFISRSNAFLVSEDGLAVTNHHCINGKDIFSVVDHQGVRHSATVLASDSPKDVAILQIHKAKPETVFKALPLAKQDPVPGDRLFVPSRQPLAGGLTLSPGRLVDMHDVHVSPVSSIKTPGVKAKGTITIGALDRQLHYKNEPVDWSKLVAEKKMASNYFSRSGVSGSPVLSGAGEVVGVNTGSLGAFERLTGRTSATPISLINAVLERALAVRNRGSV